jgi:urocanate hydratase
MAEVLVSEVINGGFGMVLDGSKASRRLESTFLLMFNGISRRNWARNEGATFAIKKERCNATFT